MKEKSDKDITDNFEYSGELSEEQTGNNTENKTDQCLLIKCQPRPARFFTATPDLSSVLLAIQLLQLVKRFLSWATPAIDSQMYQTLAADMSPPVIAARLFFRRPSPLWGIMLLLLR